MKLPYVRLRVGDLCALGALALSVPFSTVSAQSASAPDASANQAVGSNARVDGSAFGDKVCSPELIGNRGVQRQLEIQIGTTFAELCAASRTKAGLPALTPDQRSTRFARTGRARKIAPSQTMVGPLSGLNAETTPAGDKDQ